MEDTLGALAAVLAAIMTSSVVPLALPSGLGPVPTPLLCIASTSPADGEDNVSLGAPIVITFCDPVETAESMFYLSPSAGAYTFSWSAGDTLLTIHHSRPFQACTQYWATLVSGVDWYTWTFFTSCPFVPADDLRVQRM